MNAPWVIDEAEQALKIAFAGALLRTPNDPHIAARKVFPNNDHRSIIVGETWPRDPFVIQAQVRLIEELGEEAFLPSKFDVARKVFELADSKKNTTAEALACLRMYAELMEYITKGVGVQVNHTTNVQNNKVMVMTDHGTAEDWERKLIAQQTNLVDKSRE